ncbi:MULTISPECIES: YbaB/EbfC family nucleoid-associated protein [Oceanobacillus]|uniref:Nucleoid-associated protein MACH08_00280 n=1 Tax=Oceanobacillus kimchii TaxID=746691 RepID=A0ABQ5TF82_9BACI|nr:MULTISPECIES: YbaB/EbfC family nucleoid-associated protein [Oceanobacillus]MBT2599869.1 YbaB/EbfC family nucleoid-associated protein [Oceanobacillus sp. ISL-74]MBT2652681.1 YbaB/EbfC family nucleoid-associated protein [Oceanobacillus sp. ISL-73]MCT1577224.1 YbaB/EbfC family nucleoid-associated protein [Oceanobacillus kimchii]MCT2135294.1 YbaB/EbfC family nucleoid-associated protein [Oceanobacillus kimchii]OEH56559.1 nucleoid-associated protein [Oceanobacillus sp. E9]
MKGNMNNMMKQMQKMQKKMMQAQDELHEMTFEATAGGGMVTVKANGKKEIIDVEIKEEVVDPDDIDMLQDLILAATNEVLNQIDEKTNDTMGQFTKGLNMPGMF